MFGKINNPYEEVVAKATDEKQTEVNWDILLTVWDKVNEDGEAGARNCVAALQKRLQHRSANVQLFSLTLASALVNNCGPSLHREVSGKSFTSTLVRLVNDRTTHESVKKEILRLIEEWCKEYEGKEAMELMVETREGLRKQNHKFPGDRPATPVDNRRNDDALRREEEELQRALEESAKMADPRRGFVASQPPASSSSNTAAKALPQQPHERSVSPPRASAGRQRRVRAIYDFEGGQGPDELPFVKGDVIQVLETVYADWWRGELRGRSGIFPANRVEELPDAPAHQQQQQAPAKTTDADMEAELFAKSASIDKLLSLMRNLSARGENLADNEELADRYNECMALAPKVVNLIRKYDQKQAELREMNDKFTKAKATYEQMAGYGDQRAYSNGYQNSAPPHQQHQHQQQHPPSHHQQHSYAAPPPQQGPSDAERAQREHEERERREYEEKYRIYEQELAAYNAAQAAAALAQQQQYAQQHPVPGPAAHDSYAPHPAHQQAPPAHVDPRSGASPPPGATQQWATVQPQAQPTVEPVWDGQAWVYPSTPMRNPSITSQPPTQATSPPPAQGYAPPTSQAYPAQPYPDTQQPQRTAASPVHSLRSNEGQPSGIAEQLSSLSLTADPHAHPSTAPIASPALARYTPSDTPLSAPVAEAQPAQGMTTDAYAPLPQQQQASVAQLYQPNVAAAVTGGGPAPSTEGGPLSAEDQAASDAWAKYHREKAEYDAYMAQQAQQGGVPPQ